MTPESVSTMVGDQAGADGRQEAAFTAFEDRHDGGGAGRSASPVTEKADGHERMFVIIRLRRHRTVQEARAPAVFGCFRVLSRFPSASSSS